METYEFTFKKKLEVYYKLLRVVSDGGSIEFNHTSVEFRTLIDAFIAIFANCTFEKDEWYSEENYTLHHGPDLVLVENIQYTVRDIFIGRHKFLIFFEENSNLLTCLYDDIVNKRIYTHPNNSSWFLINYEKCILVWLPKRHQVRTMFEILDLFDEENLIDIVLDYLKFKHL